MYAAALALTLAPAAAAHGPGQRPGAAAPLVAPATVTADEWTNEAAAAFWTPELIESAVPELIRGDPDVIPPVTAEAARAAVPQAEYFAGTPTVGTLLYRSQDAQAHSCTASVIKSPGRNLILSAAHCNPGLDGRTAFIPKYTKGSMPFGVWAVTSRYSDPRHTTTGAGSNLDFAFGSTEDRDGVKLQDLTGGNTLTRTPSYTNPAVTVIGYPGASHDPDHKDRPIRCAPPTTRLPGYKQMTMTCDGFYGGTSGSPWMTNFNGTTGNVIGVLGGLNGGGPSSGKEDRTSYSPYFDDDVFALYDRATKGGTSDSAPPYSMGSTGTWKHARHLASGEFTGDGRDDLVTVWSDGEVTLYSGNGSGGFSGESQLAKPNTTWTHVVSLTAGQFAGRSTSDLVVRWSDGEVTLYPGVTRGGHLAEEIQSSPPNPVWLHAAVISAGRFNTTGTAPSTLMVRWDDGHLSLFSFNGRTMTGETPIGAANSTWTHATVVMAGDLAGKNTYDLVVRWSDGETTLYPDVDTAGMHGENKLLDPNSRWVDAKPMTIGSYSQNGWPDDVIVVWPSGLVTEHQNSGSSALGTEQNLVA
ncbi:hypothetical protein C8250_042850 [Streptomyces sp. So13.3]|uniref:trypsin-like serine peptidase n=1 Tax=Streptomyces sp. So13.3 TaxID=2136173 RepID=UPI001105BD08|nr:hypothetical protein [Streptomyces sp. So13.3]QNA77612.1 hypothetical protein C8250_042850 [Streptomyces sp. So13.3]